MAGIQDILKDASVWTWEIMEQSALLGEMIREDAITSVNLANINHRAQREGIGLSITSFQGAKLESELGADWMWSLGSSSWLVQAKRLDVTKPEGLMLYSIDLIQLDKLNRITEQLSKEKDIDAKPAYVFYNSMIKQLENNKADYGCMFVNGYVVGRYFSNEIAKGQKSATLLLSAALNELKARPWYEMFGSG